MTKDLVKIGKTTKEPQERANELSSSTGVPTQYEVAHEIYVNDCDLTEKIIHSRLQQFHHSKEFFKLPIDKAKSLVDEIVDEIIFSDGFLYVFVDYSIGRGVKFSGSLEKREHLNHINIVYEKYIPEIYFAIDIIKHMLARYEDKEDNEIYDIPIKHAIRIAKKVSDIVFKRADKIESVESQDIRGESFVIKDRVMSKKEYNVNKFESRDNKENKTIKRITVTCWKCTRIYKTLLKTLNYYTYCPYCKEPKKIFAGDDSESDFSNRYPVPDTSIMWEAKKI